jgi:hypothetical protein
MRIALFPIWFSIGSFAGFGLLSALGYLMR